MGALLDADRAPRIDARSRLLELIACRCQEAARRHARAGILLLELSDPDPAGVDAMHAVLGHWQRHCRDRIHWAGIGSARAGVVVAPIGFGAHADEIGELLVRAIEPRRKSRRQPATHGVSFGRSLFPDDGVDPALLLQRAERSLERHRIAAAGEDWVQHVPRASEREVVRAGTGVLPALKPSVRQIIAGAALPSGQGSTAAIKASTPP